MPLKKTKKQVQTPKVVFRPLNVKKVADPILSYNNSKNTGRGVLIPAEYDLAEVGRIEDVESFVRQAFEKKTALMFKEGWYLRGIKNNKNFRGVIPLRRRFKNTLILTIPNPSSCMHVIDGNRLVDNSEHPQVKVIYETSQMDRIITETDRSIIPPEEIFGLEPQHEWCYYYQKISLAIQRGDWETATDLADQASELGFNPINPSEWVPVFEAKRGVL